MAISAETRLVALIGHPVAHSLSPRMQNAAFAARGLDWAYVAVDVPPERLEEAVRGLAALGFVGANVTAPHKLAAAELCDEADAESVNTLLFRDGRVAGDEHGRRSARGTVPRDVSRSSGTAALRARSGAALPEARVFSRRGDWPPDVRDADVVVHATPVRDEVLFELRRGANARRAAVPGHRDGSRRSRRRRDGDRRPRGARPAGRGVVRALDGSLRAARRDAERRTLRTMTLSLVTAGESHGPALVAIVTGLPAGLVLDREAIDADLRRRQQGYGRSPRQQIEQDAVEVLAGLRHGRTLGTPLALVVQNRDHKNWTWGMSPWPPEGEPPGRERSR